MTDRPRRIEDYLPEETARVQQVCLSLASVLGDLIDEIVVVGGLVPTLLIPKHSANSPLGAHSGTVDLDVGMSIGILDEERYKEIHDRLISLGFEPDTNEQGNPTHQRWVAGDAGVTIDFLIPATDPVDKPGKLRHLDREFAAIITPGLELAFERRVCVTVAGKTHKGEMAKRDVWVCDAGPFIVLKALAFKYRGRPKDAYDLYYVVREYGSGPEEIAGQLAPWREHLCVEEALEVLRKDFATAEHLGPKRVQDFLGEADDPDLREDIVGFIARLIREWGQT